MNEARVAAIHQLELESPIKLTGFGRERALKIHNGLIQERLVRAVVKEPAKVLIIARARRIERDPALNPAGNGQTRFCFFLLDELGLGRFFFRRESLRDYIARQQNGNGSSE